MHSYVDIYKYMLRSREERRSHLSLDEMCIEIGGDSRIFRGLLAHHLQTTIPDRTVYVCHACYNSKCSNPRHLYWGTPKDNIQDTRESGRWHSIHQITIDKYGPQKAAEIRMNAARKGGKAGGGKVKVLTGDDLLTWKIVLDKIDMTKYGFISKIAKEMGCSHTQVRRVLDKYFSGLSARRRAAVASQV